MTERGDQAVDGRGRERVFGDAGQTDIRGLVTAGRAVRLEASAALEKRAWQRKPLLLIAVSRVTSTRCHNQSATAWWLYG